MAAAEAVLAVVPFVVVVEFVCVFGVVFVSVLEPWPPASPVTHTRMVLILLSIR